MGPLLSVVAHSAWWPQYAFALAQLRGRPACRQAGIHPRSKCRRRPILPPGSGGDSKGGYARLSEPSPGALTTSPTGSVSLRASHPHESRSSDFLPSPTQHNKESARFRRFLYYVLRGRDSNPRSSGYEPDEMPLLHPAIY